MTRIAFDVDGAAAVEHELLGMQMRLTETRPLLERFVSRSRDPASA